MQRDLQFLQKFQISTESEKQWPLKSIIDGVMANYAEEREINHDLFLKQSFDFLRLNSYSFSLIFCRKFKKNFTTI